MVGSLRSGLTVLALITAAATTEAGSPPAWPEARVAVERPTPARMAKMSSTRRDISGEAAEALADPDRRDRMLAALAAALIATSREGAVGLR